MKQHLIKLLLEEYKQQCLFDELEKKGVDLSKVCVNNLAIVLDIIGFPPDNSLEYDFSNGELFDERKKPVDDDLFCRDWLVDRYYKTFRVLASQQKVCVTDKGLQIETGANNSTVLQELQQYIDWLFVEFENLDSPE